MAATSTAPPAPAPIESTTPARPDPIECVNGDRFIQYSATITANPQTGYAIPDEALEAFKKEKKVKGDLKKDRERHLKDDTPSDAAHANEVRFLYTDRYDRATLEISTEKRGAGWHTTEMRGCLSAFEGAR